jgi:hypothetical protein
MPAGSKRKQAGGLLSWERRGHELLPLPAFLGRMLLSLGFGLGFTAISLLVGMWGYSHYEGMDTVDAFLNAAMILSGMGPAATLHSEGGKWFAGAYALFSGLAVIAVAGVLLAPLLHRLLHHFHADEDDINPPDPKGKQ